MAANEPKAMNAPMLSKVPAIGPAMMAPPIIPKWSSFNGSLPLTRVPRKIVTKTDAQRAKRMFINPYDQIYLDLTDLIGKKILIDMKVMKSKKVPINETINGTSLPLDPGYLSMCLGSPTPKA